jgi:putative tryptophan/tyrosine transport system substrate-binding protein
MNLRRRDFITLLGGAAAAWPLAAGAQGRSMPLIGFVNLLSAESNNANLAAFRKGLGEMGFVEGRNVTVEYRWAEGDFARLPGLVADLIGRGAAVIYASGYGAAFAAKNATTAIPVVFGTGGDPVATGLVASLNRPGGNLTGITNMGLEVAPKRFEWLHELLPQARRFAVLVNPTSPNSDSFIREAEAAAAAIGGQIDIAPASNNREIDVAFDALSQKRAEALLVSPNNFLDARRVQIVTLAALHRLPAIYGDRRYAEIGGLMSYGTSDSYVAYQAGTYVGRILKGEKPADLPVMRSSKFELVINLQTARAFGLEVPPTMLAIADEVIE